jgi:hypothetical protein
MSASLQMFRDVFIIRLCYLLGIWSDTDGNTGQVIASTSLPSPSVSSSPSSSDSPLTSKETKTSSSRRRQA